MKKVLCIVGGMNAGGAETFLMKVYRMLDTTKYQMDFAVANAEKGYYDDEILEYGGKIHHVTPKSQGIIKNFLSIRSIVKENRYEYVLRISQHSLSALELLAAWLGGAKVRTFRSSNSNTTSGSKKQLLLHNLCRFMPRWFANVRIAPSTEAAEFMFGKECIKKGIANIIHNGVDLSVWRYDKRNRSEVRQELGIPETAALIGHVGRFSRQKNHEFLLKVFKNIRAKNENAYLVLVGKGELEGKIRTQAEELGIGKSVIFTGVRSDVSRLLSAMDVFVFPSLYEGMPNTVIEAQATGLPCVISDTITREAGITGLVQYLPLDMPPESWAKVALDSMGDERVDTCREFVEKGYDIVSVAREFVHVVFKD